MKFITILGTEVLKLRRSWFLAGITIVYSLIPLVLGLFMFMLKNPQAAQKMGLLGQKAQFRGGLADWATYLHNWQEMLGVGGLMVLGLVVSWVFAREDAERCAKNLWATGVSRGKVVAAKLVVVSLIFLALNVWVAAISLAVGLSSGLAGWSLDLVLTAGRQGAIAVVLTLLLAPFTAYVALRGRGYLAPLGFTILTVVLGTIFGMTGWGIWFPWTIIPLLAGAGGGIGNTLDIGSWISLGFVALAGTWLSLRQVHADCHQ